MINDEAVSAYILERKEVTIPELQQRFSADYCTIAKIVRNLVSEEKLRLGEGVKYAVISRRRGRLMELHGDDIAKRRFYYEARRQEILERMRKEMEADDDEDDEDDGNDDNDDGTEAELFGDSEFDDGEDGGEDSEADPTVKEISEALDDGFFITESDGEHYIVPEGLSVRFRIVIQGDGVYLSDEGIALLFLEKRLSLDDDKIEDRIGTVAGRYEIDVIGEELRIKVESPENIIACLMRLFAAMERITMIDVEEVADCTEYREEDGRIWETAKGFLIEKPEMCRGELIAHMRERYRSVKDGGNIDDIVVYARGMKKFIRMTDEDYLKCRKVLLGEETKEGKADSEAKGAEAEPKERARPQDGSSEAGDEEIVESVYIKALKIVIRAGRASLSLVQRKCCIGYRRAKEILKWMESRGYIEPFYRGRVRKVLLTKKQFNEIYGPFDG